MMNQKDYTTALTNRGYVVIKSKIKSKKLYSLKKDLNVKPFINDQFGLNAKSFPIYLEGNRKLYIPKHYGFEHFGEPEFVKIDKGLPIDLQFNSTLRDKQLPIVKAFLNTCLDDTFLTKTYGGVIAVPCGAGKCMRRNTPIMMHDGTIKLVQDILVGDKLMGDDSTPRNVLSLARGRETMYKVIPTKGDSYTVNESHILSLKVSSNKGKYKKGDIVDMSVKDYLNLPPSYHGRAGPLLGYRVPIIFPEKEIKMEPYALGMWLGDGDSAGTTITTDDQEIVDYFVDYARRLGCYLHQGRDTEHCKGSMKYRISGEIINEKRNPNQFLNMLKYYNLINNKHIPHVYKCNSRKNQLELLAGIIDSDGSLTNGGYDIIQKNEKLLDDIIFLARSLGFAAYKKECKKSCTYKGEKREGTYFRTSIYGKGIEEIPVKLPRKKAKARKQIKDVLATRIRLEKQEVDDYYGFELDGNRRYVMGDFTVTHNTVMGLYILTKLARKTLIVVHKEFLMNQWIERIEQFIPNARIGKIQGSTLDIENKDIVVGMLQSLSMKEYEPNTFNSFGFTIVDECHHIGAEVFSRALPKINSYYSLGLSATPTRPDGLSKVFNYFLGPIVYRVSAEDNKKIQINVIKFLDRTSDYNKEELNMMGKICMPKMINNIVENQNRNLLILFITKRLVNIGKQTIILSDRRDHLKFLYNEIEKFTTVGYYVGGMKQNKLKESESCNVILGTYPMSSEGLDIPSLDAAIFATPKSSIEQSLGRITRKVHDDYAIAYDIVDDFSLFPNQLKKRTTVYNKLKCKIYEGNMVLNNPLNESKFEYFMDQELKLKEKKKKGSKPECLIIDD